MLLDILGCFSGVPQGSILGPHLFVIFMNDMPNCCLKSFMLIFADDGKSILLCLDGLQQDLDRCIKWASKTGMLFNLDISVFIQFGIYHTRPTPFCLKMADQVISDNALLKDSGILISNILKLGPHFGKNLKMLRYFLYQSPDGSICTAQNGES